MPSRLFEPESLLARLGAASRLGGVQVPEAPIEATELGLVCTGPGWFVVNARELRWFESAGLGRLPNLGGDPLVEQPGMHTIVGRPRVVLGVGARERHTELGADGRRQSRDDGGAYTVNEVAIRHGARFPPRTAVRYGGRLD